MNNHVTFQTRARTIDHLGREQIADCPTAISELWKNSYDAYAQIVGLHIYDDEIPVASILDDGHGMNRNEFETKWLTVGTESKTNGFDVSLNDRGGLGRRPKQGQKGIGRLSSAALGPLLLLISKREDSNFVAALIDWRMFENPFLYLHDIRIPITEFQHKKDLVNELPTLFDQLMGNIWGDQGDGERSVRLAEAWKAFSEQEDKDGISPTTQESIENTLIKQVFHDHHLHQWSVWNGKSNHGTAMIIADIQYELSVQLSRKNLDEADESEKLTRERFFQTLSNFIDPFTKDGESSIKDFSYSVTCWKQGVPNTLLGGDREFDLSKLDELEHIIEGHVDQQGEFSGRVKVFGNWIEDVKIKPRQAYKTRKDSAFGCFDIRVGTFEVAPKSSTLNDIQHSHFLQLSLKYGGFRVYRDGLRVMPYGRVDSDYFSIEERRTKHAGRAFWSNRRMFGRVSISRENNPNLKDKAGREGFIENRAAKLFREIVEKILIDSADRFFGTRSEDRKPIIEDIKLRKKLEKAEQDRKKLLTKERQRIRSSLRNNTKPLMNFLEELSLLREQLASDSTFSSLDEIQYLKKELDDKNYILQSFSLSPVPSNLGNLDDDYRYYRKYENEAKEILKELNFKINKFLSESTLKSDYEKAIDVFRSKTASINNSITKFAAKGRELLQKQQVEFDAIVKSCRDAFKYSVEGTLEDLKIERKNLSEVLTFLDDEHEKIEIDNSQKLSPFVTAIERINEQIDLEGLAIYSMNESLKDREEITRLHSLAQLGVSVEIIGHELQALDEQLSYALGKFRDTNLTEEQLYFLKKASEAHSTLFEKIRFISQMKLSGGQEKTNIHGHEISDYLLSFFENKLTSNNVQLVFSDSFGKISIFDSPSRIMPVFINLINNSIYWVQRKDTSKKLICIDYHEESVIISDNGPGVDKDDIEQLFTLFFTRRQNGGRGVGLYLSMQNLLASGHKIRYETRDKYKILDGANFSIDFKGVLNG